VSRALSGVLVGSHPYIKAGDTLQRLPRAKTPIGAWIAALIADIDSGAVAPCPHCGGWCGCSCDEWVEAMERLADCAAPLDVITVEDIPF